MARTTTTAQDDALAATDRRTFVRVMIEDPDGTLVDVGDLSDEDFFDEATIEANADAPIGRGTFSFWRAAGALSLAPLMEGSTLNRDSGDSYAPLLNPSRQITVEIATMEPGDTPTSGDWVWLWDGLIDDLDWATERITIHARDRMAQLNDTIIETVATYGDDAGTENIDDVMQDILDDVFGVGVWPLTVVGTPTLAIAEYQLGNVSVLEALTALADLIGWSLHYKWDASASEFRLTFYEPDRDNVTPSYTFGPDDYYTVSNAALGVQGIRNKGEVVYTDASGVRQTVSDTRSTSVGIYGTRFIRLDSQGTSIVTETQANNLLAAVLDDLEDPKALQVLEAALHWPIEIGDVHTYEANGVHYDTNQTWACFGYTHTITPERLRTTIQAAGKPSGGFKRWHRKETTTDRNQRSPEVVGVEVAYNGDGDAFARVRTRDAGSVRAADDASSFPDPTGETAVNVDADGWAEVPLSTGYTVGEDAYISVIAYELVAGGGRASDRAVSKATRPDPGDIVAGELSAQAQRFATDIVFSASDDDTVAWTSGTVTLALGDSYSIDAGNTGDMADLTFIYLDLDTSETVLQTSTTSSDSVGENKVLMCVARPASAGFQDAFYVPAVGVFGLNGDQLSDGSISQGKMSSGLYVPEIVASLPTLPDSDYPQGATVVLTSDDKLYRSTGSSWTAAVPTSDLSGDIDLATQVTGELSTSFAAAGLINANVTVNADGTLTGAGGGQVSLTSLPGTIAAGQIAANAVTTAKLNALAVTAAKIAAGAIETDKLAANAVTADKIAANTIEAGNIAAGAIGTDELAANAVTAAKITAGTITATQLATNAVTADKIQANAVTAAKINVASLSSISADIGTITAGTISTNVLVASESFTATTPVFEGSVVVEGGRGDPVVRLTAAGASGVIGRALFYSSASVVGNLEVIPGGFLVEAPASILALDASTEIQIRQDVLPLSHDTYDIGSSSERFNAGYFRTIATRALVTDDGGAGGSQRIGFYGISPKQQPLVTGNTLGNAALESLLTALDSLGLIDDGT